MQPLHVIGGPLKRGDGIRHVGFDHAEFALDGIQLTLDVKLGESVPDTGERIQRQSSEHERILGQP